MDWRQFWDGDHSIYVNARHRSVHDTSIADGIIAHVDRPDAVLLDYGCGEATQAARVKDRVAQLILCDGAPSVVQRLRARYSGQSGIEAILPEEMSAIPTASVDVIIVCSLIQYLSRAELEALLDRWRGLLKPGGKLVIADVIPPDVSIVTDVLSILRVGARYGFLLAALGGLVLTALSPYRRLRKEIGLSMYEEADFVALLQAHGYQATRHRPNIGLAQHRMAFVARPVNT